MHQMCCGTYFIIIMKMIRHADICGLVLKNPTKLTGCNHLFYDVIRYCAVRCHTMLYHAGVQRHIIIFCNALHYKIQYKPMCCGVCCSAPCKIEASL